MHLSVLKVLPQIISKSIIVEIHPDFVKKDGVRRVENGINKKIIVQRLYGCAMITNSFYRVKTTLKISVFESSIPHVPHTYEATKIELLNSTNQQSNSSIFNFETDTLAGTLGNATLSWAAPGTNFSIPAAKLLKNVELSYQKGKFYWINLGQPWATLTTLMTLKSIKVIDVRQKKISRQPPLTVDR